MEYAAIFLSDRTFLCLYLLIFTDFSSPLPLPLPFQSATSSFYTSFSTLYFSWFIIFKMDRKRAVAVSIMCWLSFNVKHQSAINFLPFLKFLSKFAYFSSQIPPPARLEEKIALNLFSLLSQPQQCMTSLSKLMGCTSIKVQPLIPHTRAPFSMRTE